MQTESNWMEARSINSPFEPIYKYIPIYEYTLDKYVE